MEINISIYRTHEGSHGKTESFSNISSKYAVRLERSLQECDHHSFAEVVDYLRKEYGYRPVDGDVFISDPHRMKSAAGYYVGNSCWEYQLLGEDWLWQPYDRDSEYRSDPEVIDGWVSNPHLMIPRW